MTMASTSASDQNSPAPKQPSSTAIATATPGRNNNNNNNNNYAAPHTPIASAKRPRVPTSGRRSLGGSSNANNNSNSNGSINSSNTGNGKLKNIKEERNDHGHTTGAGSGAVLTPVRKMNLDSPAAAAGGRSTSRSRNTEVPMSPMHPVKPVTHRNQEETANANNDVDVEPEAVSSGTGSVLKSIFSPVLNFLNNGTTVSGSGSTRDDVHADAHEQVPSDELNYDLDAEAYTARNEGANASTNERDSDGDVYMSTNVNDNGSPSIQSHGEESYGQFTHMAPSTDAAAADDKNNNNKNVNANVNNVHVHVQPAAAEADTNTNPSADLNLNVSASVSEHSEDQDDNENDNYEEEFNPYLFIKYLPQYHTVVPNPYHKICLPPKDPGDPPISLVLDLDETLVHCTVEPIADADMTFPVVFNGVEYKVHVRIRPFLMDFLEAVSERFEVVVFTASQEVYANELLDRIDPGKLLALH